MSQKKVQEGDKGTAFNATIYIEPKAVLDCSTAVTKSLLFKKPDGTVVTQTAVFVTDGTDGKIRYVTIAADLVPFGVWEWQARIEFVAGTWSTTVKSFQVHKNVDS